VRCDADGRRLVDLLRDRDRASEPVGVCFLVERQDRREVRAGAWVDEIDR
jgi:hypothetical protein